jgi:hypothetical protein
MKKSAAFSRAPQVPALFRNGFPYGHDQLISSMATDWATTALALGIPDKPVTTASL